MTASRVVGSIALVGLCLASTARAQSPLSLKEAERRALESHPQVKAGEYIAEAAAESTREVRSAYFPTVFASLTGAEAPAGTRIAAGGLNNPTILSRASAGLAFGQLVTDFGRTSDLVQSSRLRGDAQRTAVDMYRSDVLLQLDRAYFEALRVEAVARVADQTVSARLLVVDQVSALAAANLKSSLDLSFAKVNLSEAELMLLQAKNDVQAAYARLSAAMGAGPVAGGYQLADEPLPAAPPGDSASLVTEALARRPDVVAERFAAQSADRFADAERALWYPTVSAVGAAGVSPYRTTGLNRDYSAIGVNVNVPISNGSLFAARRTEAQLRASAEHERVHDVENRISRDVTLAALDAQTSFQRMDLTNQLLAQASDALELAQARYNLGLSSIVELTQAQLNKTRAEIEQASARYDYQERNAALRYQLGRLQ